MEIRVAAPSRDTLPSPITTTTDATFAPADRQSPLPAYIRPLPPHIDAGDIEYLTKKGALTLPDEEL